MREIRQNIVLAILHYSTSIEKRTEWEINVEIIAMITQWKVIFENRK